MAASITLDRRHIYILPNRYGMMLTVVLLVMLATSLNYGLSLGFAFTFLLGGILVVSLFHTYRNLHGLTLTEGEATPTFAGDDARFPIQIDNHNGPPRQAIGLCLPKGSTVGEAVEANSNRWLYLVAPTQQRGWLTIRRFHITTTYPLGLVRGWSVVDSHMKCLVYPKPAPDAPPLPSQPRPAGQQGSGWGEGEDFQGLRDFQEGDSVKHIHWKSWARQEILLVKQFGGHQLQELWLDYDQLAPMALEDRLSLLCRWALLAHQQGSLWGLRLPEEEIPLASGENHLHTCLRALALYGLPELG
ncbi:MAG: DUF58 domain-containing protein [Magnetococcales bacterium]|nr:DUF58 domain-containing protein [Magnetococcales bacterium]NGZ27305.1 DUF58 domain-containing protein [Magnetococcales bacterium]